MPSPTPRPVPSAQLMAAVTAAYTAVLVFATHYPRPEDLLGPAPPPDKLLHFLAYGVLGFLATATLAARGRLGGRSLTGLAGALALFAAGDETTQPWFGRSAEPLDWLYDCLGLAIGIAGAVLAARLLRVVVAAR